MSSSTCTATAATATTRATSRVSPSPTCTRRSASSPAWPRFTATAGQGGPRLRRGRRGILKAYEDDCEAALAEVKAAAPSSKPGSKNPFVGSSAVFQPPYSFAPVDTAITPGGARKDRPRRDARAGIHPRPRQAAAQPARPPAKGVREGRAVRLVVRGNAGVRLAAARRQARAALRGQDSRRGTFSQRLSVLYDEKPRERYIPLNNLAEGQARFCVYNTPLSRGGRARVRLRVLARLPEHAVPVGGAVRRFRERRADDHRPVHRVGGIEMAAAQRHRAAAAARLRGPGAGAFQRTRGAVPPGVRGGQHPGVQPFDARAVFPRAAPPDDAPVPQAAGHHDAQESAARGGGGVVQRRFHQGALPGNPGDACRRPARRRRSA